MTNDATAAGPGEARTSATGDARAVLYLAVTVGVGGVLVVDGQPSVGAPGARGEPGHLPLGGPARPCPCGARGCWDVVPLGVKVGAPQADRTRVDPSSTRWHLSREGQRHVVLSTARLVVALIVGPALLSDDAGGPLGAPALLWLVASAVLVGGAEVVRPLGRRTSGVVAALDVMTFVAVAATAPAGCGPLLLLSVVVLVHGPLRWGTRGAVLVGPPMGFAVVAFPAPELTYLAGTWTPLLVVVLELAAGYAIGRFITRQDALSDQTSLTLRLTFEHSPAGTALTDDDGVILRANPALGLLCGIPTDDLEGERLDALFVAEDAGVVRRAIAATDLARGSRGEDVRLLTSSAPHWVRLRMARVHAAGRLAARLVVQVEDVAEQRAAAERLAHDADHDALTGLPNRRVLGRRLAALVSGPCPAAALVLLDLDGFKAVNDLLGHEAGDDLLVVVADRLRAGLRPCEVALRLAGDEMVVLVAGVSTDDDARLAGQRVLAGLVGPAVVRAGEVEVRASAGVRRIVAEDDPSLVLRDADAALYRAKRGGRGRVESACRDESAAAQESVGAPAVAT